MAIGAMAGGSGGAVVGGYLARSALGPEGVSEITVPGVDAFGSALLAMDMGGIAEVGMGLAVVGAGYVAILGGVVAVVGYVAYNSLRASQNPVGAASSSCVGR